MEEIKSLIGKPTTNAPLEKHKNSSNALSPRSMVIVALIQQTQARRGLPLISAGFELQNVVLVAWEKALKNVPDASLTRAYEHAADNWDWNNGKAFGPDAVADAYKILVVEDRQRQEAEKRNAAKRKEDTYKCWHCQDVGYQFVWAYAMNRWRTSLRPCCCDSAPAGERTSEPLGIQFVRGKSGEYARHSDIVKFGVPNDSFKDAITSK